MSKRYMTIVNNDFQKVYHVYTGCYSFEAQELLNKIFSAISQRYHILVSSWFLGFIKRDTNGEIYLRVDRCGYDETPSFEIDEYMKRISDICENVVADPAAFVKGFAGWFSKVRITFDELTEAAKLLISICDGKPLSQYIDKPWNPIKAQRFAVVCDDLLKKFHSPMTTDESLKLRHEIRKTLNEIIRSA